MSEDQSPRTNGIIEKLTSEERASLYRYGVDVDLVAGFVLHEAAGAVESVYFPHAGLISLLVVMANGSIAEAGFVGGEGAVGTNCSAGTHVSFARATVVSGGNALQIPIDYFEQFMQQSSNFRTLIQQNNNRISERGQQMAACNLLHQLESRLCRWLLQVFDNTEGSDVVITQENLADMLGVNRARLNAALRTLQNLKAIAPTQRGHLKIIDADLIAQRVCDCYPTKQTAPSDKS